VLDAGRATASAEQGTGGAVKHGRPFNWFECGGYHDAPRSMGGTWSVRLFKATGFSGGNAKAANAMCDGWRREHAARRWQALQTVVAFVTLADRMLYGRYYTDGGSLVLDTGRGDS
jgi:hypothetical protein